MTHAPSRLALVRLIIPAFREAARLPRFLGELLVALADAPWRTEILVVDDGSPAADQAALVCLIEREPAMAGNVIVRAPLLLPDNRRKGGAILAGWRAASVTKAESGPAWLAFVDADGAVGAVEVRRGLEAALAAEVARPVFAVRDPASVRARPWSRRLASGLFAAYAAAVLRMPVADFQCGFKILPAGVFASLDAELGEAGFCLDLELRTRLLARGIGIVEYPVAWVERAGGHARLWWEAPRMAAAVWRLRFGVVAR